MNDKIKNLIKQCTTMECYEEGLGGGYYDEVFDKEKFAELIINECINLCQENGEDVDNGNCFVKDAKRLDLYNNYCGTGSYECAELIKQHFGVE